MAGHARRVSPGQWIADAAASTNSGVGQGSLSWCAASSLCQAGSVVCACLGLGRLFRPRSRATAPGPGRPCDRPAVPARGPSSADRQRRPYRPPEWCHDRGGPSVHGPGAPSPGRLGIRLLPTERACRVIAASTSSRACASAPPDSAVTGSLSPPDRSGGRPHQLVSQWGTRTGQPDPLKITAPSQPRS